MGKKIKKTGSCYVWSTSNSITKIKGRGKGFTREELKFLGTFFGKMVLIALITLSINTRGGLQ